MKKIIDVFLFKMLCRYVSEV